MIVVTASCYKLICYSLVKSPTDTLITNHTSANIHFPGHASEKFMVETQTVHFRSSKLCRLRSVAENAASDPGQHSLLRIVCLNTLVK